jgi:predicted DsbA family dithiol-disulfide isomerase
VKVLFFVTLAACWTGAPPPAPIANRVEPSAKVIVADTIPFAGNPAARVEIVSYFNYRCPHCIQFEPILDELARKYGQRIVIYYKTLRLPTYADADDATVAALAAHRQGKFLAMHHELIAGRAFDPDSLRGYAGKIGLDIDRFERDVADKKLRERIEQDRADAEAAEISFVPYLLINDRPFESRELADLTAHIDSLLRSIR